MPYEMLLTICPTWKRPHRLKNLIESFADTRTFADLFVYVNDDDPTLDEYRRLLEHNKLKYPWLSYTIDVHRHYVPALHHVISLKPKYEYYQEINDDCVYKTEWDIPLVNVIIIDGKGWGISCGDDMATTRKDIKDWYIHRHPAGAVLSANIIHTLGYFTYPGIDLFMGDVYCRDLAEGINRLYFLPDVKIEHQHPLLGYPKDDVRAEVQSNPSRARGRKAFMEWYDHYKDSDIKKLREAITKDTGEQW